MEAASFIQVTERYAEPDGRRMSRAEMYAHTYWPSTDSVARVATVCLMMPATWSLTTTHRAPMAG